VRGPQEDESRREGRREKPRGKHMKWASTRHLTYCACESNRDLGSKGMNRAADGPVVGPLDWGEGIEQGGARGGEREGKECVGKEKG